MQSTFSRGNHCSWYSNLRHAIKNRIGIVNYINSILQAPSLNTNREIYHTRLRWKPYKYMSKLL